jgi:hypothetical protein
MVLIKVKAEEKEKVFEVLSTNGRFIGLSDNRFSIQEHSEEVLKKLRAVGIEPEILD